MSDLPDHCKSSAPGISGSGRSGQELIPSGYVSGVIPANSFIDVVFPVTGDYDLSISRIAIQHTGIGPQYAYMHLDIDGLGSYIQAYVWCFEYVLSYEIPTIGGYYDVRVYNVRIRIYNGNYIDRGYSCQITMVGTPR